MEILKAAFVVLVIGSATSALLKILYIKFVNVYMTRNMCCNRPFQFFSTFDTDKLGKMSSPWVMNLK